MPAAEQQVATAAHAEAALRIEQRGLVRLVTLDRPEARNALSRAVIAQLKGEIDKAVADAGTRAIVIAANGPAFSGGHDLKELSSRRRADADNGRAFFGALMAECAALMQAIVFSPKPVIAAVETVASAAGCQLVASCDLAVAGANARFATPGVNIGLFCSTPMVALSRNVPRKQAMEMLLLGEMLGAEDALTYGLVNRVVPAGEALGVALDLADRIASKSPATVRIGKEAFYRQLELPLDQAYTYAAETMVENMMLRDADEGIAAFVEKRKPEWSGC